MDRIKAVKYCRERLDANGLHHWSIRLNQNDKSGFLGLCSYKDECIILNAHHVDTHPEPEINDTINHEVAHALTPGQGHNNVWMEKAKELGCLHFSPCNNLALNPAIIDAIRSGADVEITFETETVQVPVTTFQEETIVKPKYQVTRLQEKCEVCHKVAVVDKELLVPVADPEKPDKKLIFLKCGHVQIKELKKNTPYQTIVSNWWKPEVAACKHEWSKDDYKICTKCNENRLYEFQVEGSRFLENAVQIQQGGMTADEMGLGKTVQSLAFIKYASPEMFPMVFVVKSKIKYQWFKEVLRWLGPAYIPQVIEKSTDIPMPLFKCYIISYDLMVPKLKKSKKSGKVSQQGFDINKLAHCKTVVADEIQQIKNPDSTRTQQFRLLCKDKKVIGLSGTPWKNRGSEYFSILNILAPQKFPSYAGFIRDWVDSFYDGKYLKQGGIKNIAKFKEYVKDIVIRREIADVGIQMPAVNRQFQFSNLDEGEQFAYDHAESDFVKWYNDHVINGTDDNVMSDMHILAQMQKMRHLVGIAKISATMEYLETFYEETTRKIVIFTHHKDVMDILYRQMKESFTDIPILKMDSGLSSIDMSYVQDRFNNSPRAFMVASTLAAGEGLNLQTCADAIMHERQWNPMNEDQAAPGRFRRIGSAFSTVNVIFMTAADTIDEMLSGIVERKRAYFHNAMNKGEVQVFDVNIAKELAQGIMDKHREKGRLTKMASLR